MSLRERLKSLLYRERANARSQFMERPLEGTEPARCVDGRACSKSPEGPQMLGGSLHPLVLKTLYTNSELNESTIRKDLGILKEKGFSPGAHRGSHQDTEHGVCDCGFCDRLDEIITTAQEKEEEIKERLKPLMDQNGLNSTLLSPAYDRIRHFSLEKIKSRGEPLLLEELTNGAICEIVEGEHAEEIAFVNLKEGTTFDTKKANEIGHQAFNLDLWIAAEQSQALGVTPNFAIPASLILYQATEMVLVENKGKSPLPVVVHR